MATTYDFIAQNKRRTWLLVLLFPLTFVALGYVFLWGVQYFSLSSYRYDATSASNINMVSPHLLAVVESTNQIALQVLPWLWLGAVLWIVIAYYTGDRLLLRGAGAIEIYRDDQPEIYRLVENLCISQGLPMPRVYIINDESLNAFATGRDPQHASVALTKGIVKKLERAELEGVVAHELAHIQNRDIRLMLLAVAGISFFTFLSEICFRAAFSTTRHRRGKNDGWVTLFLVAAGIFFAIYGFVIAPLIRLALSRTREYQADATAALITRNPGALARALEKIAQDARVEVLDKHASMAAMCIENPLSKKTFFASISGVFSTHPPIEKRIECLRRMDSAQ